MSYTAQASTNRKAMTAGIVAVIQGAAIVALVNGLTLTIVPRDPPPRIQGEQIKLTPPPPKPDPVEPKVEPKAKPKDTHFTVPPKANDLLPPASGTTVITPVDPSPIEVVKPVDLVLPPPVKPTYAPVRATPRNSPGNWASTSDYPSTDLRAGHQGIVGFEVTVNIAGRVDSCRVTQSSGYLGLDAATCEKVTARARFTPARDGTGTLVRSTYSSRIRWVIPD